MIMMYYIITFLSAEESISLLRGGPQIQTLLNIGRGVLALFSVIFFILYQQLSDKKQKKRIWTLQYSWNG